MKYSLILLLSLVVIVGISAPAHAQTITDHVVINEVDTNPLAMILNLFLNG